ncbi:hypothetical protein [Bosea sp. NBC_00550]|uniref:hypothetical protein n=1 Tax=Bosea sp. NBC_00550 TaxID=2969621 RepID=UPI002231950A|nr:hypothetical protein [Bosea sp. NBC_00550]UZF93720.1 hypothetical protein NWE53_05870 [Bosea sp. NBC_00550]
MVSDLARTAARRALYTLSPSTWSRRELGLDLDPWQRAMTDAPAGSRVIALTHRQAGKTSAASVGVAHTMIWRGPGTTNLILAPTQRQSAELIRRLRGRLIDSGEKLDVDNAFSVELQNGSRCLGLPGADDAAIRGLSIDGDLVIDEAARVSDALYDAARPMMIRHSAVARLILLSTAWAKMGFFYRVWTEGDPHDWLKIEARVADCRHISAADLEKERRAMSASTFAREYQNHFDSMESRFFDADAIAAAFSGGFGPTPQIEEDPVVSVGSVFGKVFP